MFSSQEVFGVVGIVCWLVRCLAKGVEGVEEEKTKRDNMKIGRRRRRRRRR